MERFKQRYNSEKNYKKAAQRFVMNALENKKKRKSSIYGTSQQDDSNSQLNEFAYLRQLSEEQEADIQASGGVRVSPRGERVRRGRP